MPKVDDVVGGEPIESTWGNQSIRDRTVQRALNAADLAAGWPAPGDGETVWQQDTDELKIWDGTAWMVIARIPDLDAYLKLTGGTLTGTVTTRELRTTALAPHEGNALYDLASSTNKYRRLYVETVFAYQLTPSSGSTGDIGTAVTTWRRIYVEEVRTPDFVAAGGLVTVDAPAQFTSTLAVDGGVQFESVFLLPNITETTNVPNVFVQTDGRLYKSTNTAASAAHVAALEARIAALEA